MLRTRVRAGIPTGIILSVVFAALFTLVFAAEFTVRSWVPRYGAPAPYAIRVPFTPQIVERSDDSLAGRYELRRIVVPRGMILDRTDEAHRIAFAYESSRRPIPPLRIVGVGLLYATLSLLLVTYARRFGPSAGKLLRTQIGLFILLLVSLAVAKAMLLFTSIPEYWIPIAPVPLWLCLYLDRRSAFLVNVILAFFAASLQRLDVLLFVVLLVRGIASTLAFSDKKHPRQMFVAGVVSGLASAVLLGAVMLLFDRRFDGIADLKRGLDSSILACIGGGVLSGAIAVVFREPAERLLGAVGRDRLLDLTDLEKPLLQKMAKEAPGSWEHARAMANLAEQAASAIGADALLTRCGAYYHDLGKTIQPKFFVENLAPGETTPHDELEPHVSADAIMAHVVQGTKILRDGGVPEPVVEFAYTHHGTQIVEFFWHKCKEQGNPHGLTEDSFRYPGMKPRTKETAILMLVDSIEAASRTISPPQREKFEEMIQRVTFTKLKAGQLDDCGLTPYDLRLLVTRMADTLVNMYHGRIKYPWQQEKKASIPPPSASPAKVLAAKTPAPKTPTPAAGTPGSPGTPGNVVRLPSRPPEK